MSAETENWLTQLQAPVLQSRGSSLKFMILASGKAALYPRLGPTMEWDTAAAQAILEGAGGIVVSYPEGKPLRYNKPDLLNPFFIARGQLLQ
jgi:3'(2'), 5'-bisphosphate nucleotidase